VVLLQIRDNQQFINFDENIDDSLGNIVIINENNDGGLTTRQGATFDDDITASLRYAAFDEERKPHVKRPSDRRHYSLHVSWHKDTTDYSCLLPPLVASASYFHLTSYFLLATSGGIHY
jgi:hypothetical protein